MKDHTDEFHTLINMLMNINNFTINDMIYNMTELIRNSSEKVSNLLNILIKQLMK